MRYRVQGAWIRSENAAKPASQASQTVLSTLRQLGPWSNVLDLGCGKLRYGRELLRLSESVTFADSQVQIDRNQRILGSDTSVRRLVSRRWDWARVLSLEELLEDRVLFDFILCANVLSAIPSRAEQARLFRLVKVKLKASGTCLFVTQHRNSEFAEMQRRETASPYSDGWVLNGARSVSYYGVLDCAAIARRARRYGLRVVESWIRGESSFVLTTAN